MRERYYQWLVGFVTDDYHAKYYTKLLRKLHETEFTWSINLDENRAVDGIDMRVRFADQHELQLEEELYPLDGPCSVLEMMVALAVRCEESIMGDAIYGDRTGDWFWVMIGSLDLYGMDDYKYKEREVSIILENFLARNYQRNGKGGLFTVENSRRDMRKTEIWYQMQWYLNTL